MRHQIVVQRAWCIWCFEKQTSHATPPLRPAQFESAVDILPEQHSSEENGVQPLNLSVIPELKKSENAVTTGDNTKSLNGNASVNMPSVNNLDNLLPDGTGTMEDHQNPQVPQNITEVNNALLAQTFNDQTSAKGRQVGTRISVFKLSKPLGFDMDQLNCVVKLKRIEDVINDESSEPNSLQEYTGYHLHDRNNNVPPRAPCATKKKVNYKQDSDFSSDDYSGTSPVRKQLKPDFPMRGPSMDRMAVHTHAQLRSKEKDAVEALLVLNQGREVDVTGDNNDNAAKSSQDKQSFTDYSADSTSSESNYRSDNSSDDSVKAASDSTNDGSSSSDTQISNIVENSFDSEDDTPLAIVKESMQTEPDPDQPKKGKAYFKTTSHGLRKPKKHSRKFPCEKCDFAGTSQGELNTHFLDNHGQLVCNKCSKNYATISAYRKHLYEHSDHAKKHPCADCNRSFLFASQLKNHCKLHLSVPEHGCIHCQK